IRYRNVTGVQTCALPISAIAAMFYPDLIQRFLPFRILFLDRGRWLERSWENAWRNTMQTDRFAKPFLDLWQDRHLYVPSLLLNRSEERRVGNESTSRQST